MLFGLSENPGLRQDLMIITHIFLHMQLTMVFKQFRQKVLSQVIVSRCTFDFITYMYM